MAYRQGNRLIRVIVLAVILFAGYRYGLPWIQKQGFVRSGSSTSQGETPNVDCVMLADDAVGVWSRGIVRFMTPPVDAGAWADFRDEVERNIDRARNGCRCAAESCSEAQNALSDVSRLLTEMDAAARSGGAPPSDLVRAQERIDLQMENAWKLADAGK